MWALLDFLIIFAIVFKRERSLGFGSFSIILGVVYSKQSYTCRLHAVIV